MLASTLLAPVKKLYSHYETYHGHGRPLLKYIGIIGALTYIAFYLIRFTRPNPRPLDDLGLRLAVPGDGPNAIEVPRDAPGTNRQLRFQLLGRLQHAIPHICEAKISVAQVEDGDVRLSANREMPQLLTIDHLRGLPGRRRDHLL